MSWSSETETKKWNCLPLKLRYFSKRHNVWRTLLGDQKDHYNFCWPLTVRESPYKKVMNKVVNHQMWGIFGKWYIMVRMIIMGQKDHNQSFLAFSHQKRPLQKCKEKTKIYNVKIEELFGRKIFMLRTFLVCQKADSFLD